MKFRVCREVYDACLRVREHYGITISKMFVVGLVRILENCDRLKNSIFVCRSSETKLVELIIPSTALTFLEILKSRLSLPSHYINSTALVEALRWIKNEAIRGDGDIDPGTVRERFQREYNRCVETLKSLTTNMVENALRNATPTVATCREVPTVPTVDERKDKKDVRQSSHSPRLLVLPVENVRTVEKVVYRIPRLSMETWWGRLTSLSCSDYVSGNIVDIVMIYLRDTIPLVVDMVHVPLFECCIVHIPFTRHVLDRPISELEDMTRAVIGREIDSSIAVTYLGALLASYSKTFKLEVPRHPTQLRELVERCREHGVPRMRIDVKSSVEQLLTFSVERPDIGSEYLRNVEAEHGKDVLDAVKHSALRAVLMDVIYSKYGLYSKLLSSGLTPESRSRIGNIEKYGEVILHMYTTLRALHVKDRFVIDPAIIAGTLLPSHVDLYRLPPHLEFVMLNYMMHISRMGKYEDMVIESIDLAELVEKQ